MYRNILTTAALTALLAVPGYADVDKVADVKVTADITAIENETAATYWAGLAEDLQNAIASRVTDRTAEEGATISVDIREVELSNAFDAALKSTDAVLVGQVNVSDPTDNSNQDGYELSVSLEGAQVLATSADGLIVLSATDTPGAYQQLVDSFADGVVARLK
jgi:hypothetical protein